jgi:2-polyprenyl-3-methyl-5-hydroxy-6-metoxy-1,4-benzoquinol methylase
MQMVSPITDKNDVELIEHIDVNHLASLYKKDLGTEVRHFFKDLDQISVYECLESGYRFYYPFFLSGDSAFYESLQRFDWYYMDEKWEHQQMLGFDMTGKKILEVGCGSGSFVKALKDRFNADVTGLELNAKTVATAREMGINVLKESVQDHADGHEAIYDHVCSFQVLEHIADPVSFMKAQVRCLKKGGLLIVSVPNNDSFIKYERNILNMPPHHMGLWTESSLIFLGKSLGLKIAKVLREPLQPYHVKAYSYNFIHHRIKAPVLLKIMDRTGLYQLIASMIRLFRKRITGHSILMVYQK